MARKSRRTDTIARKSEELPVPFEAEAKEPAAVYGRLSVEDEAGGEVKEVQIQLVRNFIDSQSSLQYAGTYFDNGYTGTNFERPDFNRLMNDVRKKKVTCIVVKDLSRFGRNVLESTYYIEKIFPFLGVRLIAVTDNFDSSRKEDMESLNAPLRNLVNAMYAKDISKKVWTSLQRKKKEGYATGAAAPYGYIRNPVTKRNEIDPETAFYVQLIFMWAMLGVPVNETASRLQLLGAPTPRERLHQLGVIKNEKEWVWHGTSVRVILENQTYVGDTVGNKTSQALFAGQEKILLTKEEWIITRDTHPAIIARDDFEKVQVLLGESRERHRERREASKEINAQYVDEMPEMVYCADCGTKMTFDRLPHGAEEKKKVAYYQCKGRDLDKPCLGHQITAELLKMMVMDQVRHYLLYLCDSEKLLVELEDGTSVDSPIPAANSRYLQANARANEIAEKRHKLYEDYIAGIVDIEEYQEIREAYMREFEQCRRELEEAHLAKQETERQIREYRDMVKGLRKYLDVRSFDPELVQTLVERVEVGSGRRIHTVFKFRPPFAQYLWKEEQSNDGMECK